MTHKLTLTNNSDNPDEEYSVIVRGEKHVRLKQGESVDVDHLDPSSYKTYSATVYIHAETRQETPQ